MSCNPYSPTTMNFVQLAPTQENISALLTQFGNTIGYSPSGAYTAEQLTAGANFAETLVRNLFTNQAFAKAYPETNTRILLGGPISNLEYEEFLVFSGVYTDPTTYEFAYDNFIQTLTNSGSSIADITDVSEIPDILEEYLDALEAFNDDNYGSKTTGNFCSAFNGLIDQFFKIKELVLSVPAVFKGIEQLLKQLVDTITEKVKDIVNGIISQAIGFMSKAQSMLLRVVNFFSEENIEKIKKQIEEFMGSIANKFENLTPEVIAQMLFKFCQLSSAIEELMLGPSKMVSDVASRFQKAESTLTAISNQNITKATQHGAFILDRSKINGLQGQLARKVAETDPGAADEIDVHLSKKDYVTMAPTQEELDMVNEIKTLTKAQISSGSYKLARYVNLSALANQRFGEKSWKAINHKILLIAKRVSERIGKTLRVTSGYRNNSYAHGNGWALDIGYDSWSQGKGLWNDFAYMIRVCSEEGASGIGVYPPALDGKSGFFIHIDMRPYRTWWGPGDTGANTKKYAPLLVPVLEKHEADGFRKSDSLKFNANSELPIAPPIVTSANRAGPQ